MLRGPFVGFPSASSGGPTLGPQGVVVGKAVGPAEVDRSHALGRHHPLEDRGLACLDRDVASGDERLAKPHLEMRHVARPHGQIAGREVERHAVRPRGSDAGHPHVVTQPGISALDLAHRPAGVMPAPGEAVFLVARRVHPQLLWGFRPVHHGQPRHRLAGREVLFHEHGRQAEGLGDVGEALEGIVGRKRGRRSLGSSPTTGEADGQRPGGREGRLPWEHVPTRRSCVEARAVCPWFSGEKVRESYALPTADVTEREPDHDSHVVALEALVRMKLNSFRDKDRTHLRDLISLGLVDASWLPRCVPEHAARLQQLLDDPDG